jgi:hypothetical protein
MRTKRGTPETLRWSASEVYGLSRSLKGLQTASAKSMNLACLARLMEFRFWPMGSRRASRFTKTHSERAPAISRHKPDIDVVNVRSKFSAAVAVNSSKVRVEVKAG